MVGVRDRFAKGSFELRLVREPVTTFSAARSRTSRSVTSSSTELFSGSAWVSRSLMRKSLIVFVFASAATALSRSMAVCRSAAIALSLCTISLAFALACTAITAVVPPTTASNTAAASAAIAGFRLHQSQARSAAPTRRAVIGRESSQACRSSASAWAEA